MASKATYQDQAELEETAEVIVDRSRTMMASLMTVKRQTPTSQQVEPAKPAAAILPIYLREMGSTALIDETQEVALARELQEGRQGIAKIAVDRRRPLLWVWTHRITDWLRLWMWSWLP